MMYQLCEGLLQKLHADLVEVKKLHYGAKGFPIM